MALLNLTAAVLLGDAGHHTLATLLWIAFGLRLIVAAAEASEVSA